MGMAGSLLMAACGGGGSSSTPAASANLSATQQAYERVALAQNGGQHLLNASLAISTSSTSTISVNPANSYLFTTNESLPQSPASAGPQMMTIGTSTVDPKLSVPTQTAPRFLVNGAVVVEALPQKIQVSYNGANIQSTLYAQDGTTAVETLLVTQYVSVPLTGTIASSPSELASGSAFGVLTNTFNGASLYNTSATWQSGAAYAKATRQFVGDTVEVGDCATPATTGASVTACATTATTLEGFFPHTSASDDKTYNLADGQIVTLAGTRAWVATAARNSPTTEYRVYYQSNGQIFSAVLVRDGTPSQIDSLGTNTPQNFEIYLNQAAVQSLTNAIAF
ncbi:hypothetical protein FAZ98_29695 [Paraburkholderia acidisoli]|uniref:Uncharacterized protein n=2 Tax=Paraburkholderia acidisoli TaxID=2571748 RepID=A0A7Z2GQQ2_9BURK|nr:hypothetical protein FAZ98_29695 [Paraburkholderia acidisoli]